MEKDFFRMSVVALKLIFTEDHDVDYLGDIDPEELQAQVRDENIPFHRWYKWLEDRFYDHTGIERITFLEENIEKQETQISKTINSSEEGDTEVQGKQDSIFTGFGSEKDIRNMYRTVTVNNSIS
jgi:hypothetical protein